MEDKNNTFNIKRDNQRPLRFTGTCIAVAKSSPDSGRSDFSGRSGVRDVLELYQTQSGGFVAARARLTQWQGARDTYDAIAASSKEEIMEFFGFGWLAMDLYATAEWDIAEDLDAVA